MTTIQNCVGQQIFDSRGMPTVACHIELDNGVQVSASVPSGASTGMHEACELRDQDMALFQGKGVLKAVQNINDKIAPKLIGMDPEEQHAIDQMMMDVDGTAQKNKLGANAMLAVSLANARAAAALHQLPLFSYLGGQDAITMPVPMINVINGGQHANNNLDIQEFMIVPSGFGTFSEALRAGSEIFHVLKQLLHESGMATAVGDEGGFAPNLPNNKAALELLMKAIEKAHYRPGEQVYLALDLASSCFYDEGTYTLSGEKKQYTMDGWIDIMAEWITDFPILSLEDVMAEDHREGWQQITSVLGGEIQLVGDDVFVTQQAKLQDGIDNKMANSILIKPNQVGTLTETLMTVSLAQRHQMHTVVSHRSGETEDTFIADLAVATNAGQIKTGGFCRSERIAKYNRLLAIDAALGDQAYFPGTEAVHMVQQPMGQGVV